MLLKIINWNPRLFTLFGVPVTCHVSLIILMAALLFFSPKMFVLYLLTLLCIIPHEFGHVLAARYYGHSCRMVVMTPLGGMALLEGMPSQWKKEFWVASWGPIVTLILAIIFLPLSFLSGFFMKLFLINVFLFAFNILPIFPMDGGRILRSLLGSFLERKLATTIATRTSQVMCVGLFALGVLLFDFAMVFIAIFIAWLAQKELESV